MSLRLIPYGPKYPYLGIWAQNFEAYVKFQISAFETGTTKFC